MLVVVFLFGCSREENKFEKMKSIYPKIDEITAVDGSGKREIRLYVIDSCEYIGYINCFNSDLLTHKGNCKFCLARHAK
jgi:hypothetical protein